MSSAGGHHKSEGGGEEKTNSDGFFPIKFFKETVRRPLFDTAKPLLTPEFPRAVSDLGSDILGGFFLGLTTGGGGGGGGGGGHKAHH